MCQFYFVHIYRFDYNEIVGLIKNYQKLATTGSRKVVLDLVEAALAAIQPEVVFAKHFVLDGRMLKILDVVINLSKYDRILLLGFGKGSAGNCQIAERLLGNKLSAGYVIDVSEQNFSRVEFTLGTHPLPSAANIEFTKKVTADFSTLSERDLVIIITCGGGSALFEEPRIPLEKLRVVDKALLESGADIAEMNIVRKHLSKVKGGGLAKIISPATVVNLIFSDVAGNDLTVIASGPTVLDPTTCDDAWKIISKYQIDSKVSISREDFIETPKDKNIFDKIHNILFLSNLTALNAMKSKATDLGINAQILTDHFQGNADGAGKQLIDQAKPGSVLLAGGETTVKVKSSGQGGRNQELVLAALADVSDKTTIVSFDSDGWDNCELAGAIGDKNTIEHARALNFDPQLFLNKNDTLNFFKQSGDGIETGRLPANVSDLMIVYKSNE